MTDQVRRAILMLVCVSCVGVFVELAFTRHWTKLTQLIGWVAPALVLAGAVALLGTPNAATMRMIRASMLAVVVSSLVGVVLHVVGNYEAGPLDGVRGTGWEAMSVMSRWWLAISQRVGPAPAVAPLIVSQLAALVHLVTIGRPAPISPPDG